MRGRPRITIAQTQRLALNPALHASIRLMRADAAGVALMLDEAAAENPALRIAPPPERGPADWLPRWQTAFAGLSPPSTEPAAPEPGLIAHVAARSARLLRTPRERQIATALAEALEPTGWLGRPVAAIADDLRLPVAEVEEVLFHLQHIDPPGLFARDLAECLRLQAEDAGRMDATLAVVLDHLDLLATGALDRLARLADTSGAEIMLRLRLIRSFNPKPGAVFSPLAPADLREPDLIVVRGARGTWEISINRCALPSIDIAGSGPQAAAARALTAMIERRNGTLLAVAAEVLRRQTTALEGGREHLVPMTMASVAEAIGLHESTVSRLIAGVQADTPAGTLSLRALFSAGVAGTAAEAIRKRLNRLVSEEDGAHPLTDAELAERLAPAPGGLARRTIAKYRAQLGIPTAARRRRLSQAAPEARRPV